VTLERRVQVIGDIAAASAKFREATVFFKGGDFGAKPI